MIGCGQKEASPELFQQAMLELNRGETHKARLTLEKIPESDPTWLKAQMNLGDLAATNFDAESAVKYYESAPRDKSPLSLAAAFRLVNLEQSRGRLSRVIEHLKYILECEPDHHEQRSALANLYAATGQRWLADQEYTRLMIAGKIEFKQLVLLTDLERSDPEAGKFLKDCELKAPDDPAVNFGLAIVDMAESKLGSARRRLELAVENDPQLGAAQALLGTFLLETGGQAFVEWHRKLPESVRDHP
jgi:Tfp pilus assembly protein PilF